ncbi:MAG: serine--tRNA ligase [Bacteroidia bacterium]|nr:serine--tRNA ligase [Bacteroidia bacterium]
MLEIQYLRQNSSEAISRLTLKTPDAGELIAAVLKLDEEKRISQMALEEMQARINAASKETGDLYKAGKKQEADKMKAETASWKEELLKLEAAAGKAEQALFDQLTLLPNLPDKSVPPGRTPQDNLVVHEEGTVPQLPEGCLPHWDLAKKYKIIDFETGVKVSGAGFPVYTGKGARLQRALINFFLDKATEAGYTEIEPPILINEASGFGTGQLPDKEGQMYFSGQDKLYLIPTAEVPITNMYRDTILDEEALPVKNCGYTPCFRREAGSYGKDVRGLNRLHQFDKVEIVQIQHPDKSYQTLQEMRNYVAGLLRMLELPFRILKLCGGDMSFASALTFDLEVFSAAQKRWLEVSSVSNFETFQSNRMKLRFRQGKDKPRLAHTLNGSALALPRIVAALLENNQTPEGVRIPKALTAYTGFGYID